MAQRTGSPSKEKGGAAPGVVAPRAVVSPDVFDGTGSMRDWFESFEACADLNGWSDEEKLKWLKVRLGGQALRAFLCFSDEERKSYQIAKVKLTARFDPPEHAPLHRLEFDARGRSSSETWQSYADVLRCIAERAFPDFSPEVRDFLALQRYLKEVKDRDVAVGVRRAEPKSLDAAVRETLVQENILRATRSAHVIGHMTHDDTSATAAQLAEFMNDVTERLAKLESAVERRNSETVTGPNGGSLPAQSNQMRRTRIQCAIHLDRVNGPLDEIAIQASCQQIACGPLSVAGKINGVQVYLLIDTGAARSLLSYDTWCLVNGSKEELRPFGGRLLAIDGGEINHNGVFTAMVSIGTKLCGCEFVVTKNFAYHAILGCDFLLKYGCVIDMQNRQLTMGNSDKRIQLVSCHLSAPTLKTSFLSIDSLQPSEKDAKLCCMINESSDHLTGEQKQRFQDLVDEFQDAFAWSDENLGRTTILKHKIDTGSAKPVRQMPRRLSPLEREEVAQMIRNMERRNLIEKSVSPWASRVVPVRKRDGTLRLCVDYRALNAVTKKDAYPLPRIDEALDAMQGSVWFSTLDLMSGFWQVELEDGSQEKTAFTTHEGLYHFKVLPFGLTGAPATFQRLMEQVLSGLNWKCCVVYLDDVIIFARNYKEHLYRLREVLERLRKAGLKARPDKCKFFRKEIKYLGHVVTEDGVSPDPELTDKIVNYPEPKCLEELRSFVGLASYYRKFISGFANIAKPLHQLSEKGVSFIWNESCQKAFLELKGHTDASDVAMGAILSQIGADGLEHPVAFASKSFSKAQRNYCVTRREMLAVVTFVDYFRPYLQNRRFTLRTDHEALRWLQTSGNTDGQWARWQERLQQFDFVIMHRPGKQHLNADALSRIPCLQCGRKGEPITQRLFQAIGTVFMRQSDKAETRKRQLNDPYLRPFLLEKEKGNAACPGEGADLWERKLRENWQRLEVHDGILYRRWYSDDGSKSWLQMVIPHQMTGEVLHELHGGVLSGHLGERKTIGRVRERFYWPGYCRDVTEWVRRCSVCCARKSPVPKRIAPLQLSRVGRRWERVALDILGPLPCCPDGNRYILVIMDYFTKYAEAYGLPNQESGTVADKLVNEFICRYGIPESIHSDQGRQFESKLITDLCTKLGIRKTRTTPYRPQSDGLVERMNRSLTALLTAYAYDNPTTWTSWLPKVMLAYRTSVHVSTGETPFFLMFGQQCRMPVDLMVGEPVLPRQTQHEYVREMAKEMERAFTSVRTKLGVAQKRQKLYYDRYVHGAAYEEGDFVFMFDPSVGQKHSRKLRRPWKGPYRILKCFPGNVYRIQHLEQKRDRRVVHFDRLKPCPPDIQFDTTCNGQQGPGTVTQTDLTVGQIPSRIFKSAVHCLENQDDVLPPNTPETDERTLQQPRPKRSTKEPF
uniref:RNA-directed DNA polymerase n=1 Tax=Trichuris muris TaxID=70415 RepID=A0A5S6Q6P2_TRIMR